MFQAPSLDKKLTVAENLRHQGHLYGLSGAACAAGRTRCSRPAGPDRSRRRTGRNALGRIAAAASNWPKACCTARGCCCSTSRAPGSTRPPAATCGTICASCATEHGVTVVLTTHLLEEADKADRIAILHAGRAGGARHARRSAGDRRRRFDHDSNAPTRPALAPRFASASAARPRRRRARAARTADGHQWIARLVEAFPGQIQSITLGKPTLEDVFIDRTGHRFLAGEALPATASAGRGADAGTAGKIAPEASVSTATPSSPPAADAQVTIAPQPIGRSSRARCWPPPRSVSASWVRFVRQRNRVFGAIGQPLIFWLLFGLGLGPSFRLPGSAGDVDLVSRVFLSRLAGADPAVHGHLRHDLDHRRSPRGLFAIGAGRARLRAGRWCWAKCSAAR